ncbi:MAG: RHS repeat-associated core domain-containing protein, partial [Anaerolineales bacterium]|nr:RHS repeat-associated core domain-containing protein [Anaerolineales bacterium]
GPNDVTDRGFTGQKESMADLGLYYYNARWYSPLVGRFLSADTLVPDPANPQSFNRYSYGLNNPLKYIDPTGHKQERALVIGGGDVGNGGFSDFGMLQNALLVGMTWAGVNYAYNHPDIMWAVHDTLKQVQASLVQLSGYTASTPPPKWDPDNDPNKNQYGRAREDYIRQFLRNDGWTINAESDTQVRTQLGLRGESADFLGTKNGRYLIGESKGMNIDKAVSQLQQTVDGLFNINPSAMGNTDVHLYVNQTAWDQLSQGWLNSYRVQNGILQWYDGEMWNYTMAGNELIQVFVIP